MRAYEKDILACRLHNMGVNYFPCFGGATLGIGGVCLGVGRPRSSVSGTGLAGGILFEFTEVITTAP